MSMMYPRLMLARNLLTEDGVIFISIDDNEHSNLRQLCDQVFGPNNFVASFIWRKKFSLSFVANEYISVHEYVVCVRRGKVLAPVDCRWNKRETVSVNPVFKSQNAESVKTFRKGTKGREIKFEIPKGLKKLGAQTIEFLDKAVVKNGVLVADIRVRGRFAIGQEKLDQLASQIELTPSGSAYVMKHSDEKEIRPISVFFDYSGGSVEELAEVADLRKAVTTRAATAALEELLGGSFFDNPKPVALIQFLVETFDIDSSDSVVLDFFAGSGTTGHAVLAQNAKDGGSRRFVLVQLPERVEKGSEAAKAGFGTIADITKERVRRAAKEIAKEAGGVSKLKLADGSGRQDLGFRVFKLDKSNFRVWDAAAPAGDEAKLAEQLRLQVEHVEPGRGGLDVVFEVLLKSKLPLTSKVEKTRVSGGEVWSVESGRLLVVVDEGVDLAGVRELAKRDPKPETVVFLDRCFGGKDSLKANTRKIFQDADIEFRTI
jgi:adenine-specific DNA-methyltransferase